MTDLGLDLPAEGDVIDLILADHRRFEELLRDLRDDSNDRDAVRRTLATLHVAHAEAEEQQVYPTLRADDAVSGHDAEHGKKEHAEGNKALLDVLDADQTSGQDFDDLVEELARLINHHLTEEELTILNPARHAISPGETAELGAAFLGVRNKLIESECGAVENVRAIVEADRTAGLLDDEDDG